VTASTAASVTRTSPKDWAPSKADLTFATPVRASDSRSRASLVLDLPTISHTGRVIWSAPRSKVTSNVTSVG
jgi:hypothetical protein